MALGLPIAVTVGWVLAGPATQPSAATLPGGSGGIGAAPQRATSSEPVTAVRYSSRPFRPPASAAAASALVSPSPATSGAPVVIPSAPSPSASTSAPPLLTDPPVPTPTEIVSTPSAAPPPGDPSATASDPS